MLSNKLLGGAKISKLNPNEYALQDGNRTILVRRQLKDWQIEIVIAIGRSQYSASSLEETRFKSFQEVFKKVEETYETKH